MQLVNLILSSFLIPLIFQTSILYNYYYDYVEEYFRPDIQTESFDFIVVGSGSSGTVVAHRLSKHYKVLLIEAGGDPSVLSSIPGFALELLGRKEHDWLYKSIKRENIALGHTNQEIFHNRGKVMGGCSTLNYMMYLRGHPFDYDSWANSTGDESWNYENLLPFFKKSIKTYNGSFKDKKKHYESSPYGFLSIEKVKFERMLGTWLDAGKDIGLNGNVDANAEQSSGTGVLEVSQRNGARGSTYASIIKDNQSKNLRISKYSQVTKVKLDRSGRATGVWFYKDGKKYFVEAKKEVILSAGAYDSPKLLMLSGVGPKDDLESIGIKAKVDLPVGKNLQDHFGVFLFGFLSALKSSFVMDRDLGLYDFYEYFTKGTGFFSVPNGLSGQFFYSTTEAKKAGDWPDVQSFFSPVGGAVAAIDVAEKAFSLKREVFDEAMIGAEGLDGFGVLAFLVRPKSVGEVTLRDKNPFSDPVIDSNPFSHPDDMRAMIEGINASISLVEDSDAFKKVEGRYGAKAFSSCSMHIFRSNDYWECYIRHTLYSVWHPVGTCKMSRKDDPTAVVDSQLRVLHTRGLRVIDSSIMPLIVNANTNAPAIMIGERGADFVLEYWSNQYLVCNYLEPLITNYNTKCFYSQSI